MIKTILLLFILVSCAAREESRKEESSACNTKSCGEMISCPEVMYNFLQCGRKELDNDEDGQPCETICKEL